ncbi:MAG: hypothetical protein L0F91_05775 [Lactococcus lactis]|nr:hypothetical protein [Lactococcus lactis]
MAELALEKMRTAINKYREESGISIKTLAFSLEGISEQQLRNALNKKALMVDLDQLKCLRN